MSLFIGVDIGTSSSKGVLVNGSGEVLSQAVRSHEVSRPHPGWVEMDAHIWWQECVAIMADSPIRSAYSMRADSNQRK